MGATVWWDPGMSRRKKLHITVSRRAYRVTATAVALPGEEQRLYALGLVPASGPVAASAVADESSAATTLTAVRRL